MYRVICLRMQHSHFLHVHHVVCENSFLSQLVSVVLITPLIHRIRTYLINILSLAGSIIPELFYLKAHSPVSL